MDWLSPIRDFFGFILLFLDRVSAIRAMLGFTLVFFLPGFAWTMVFFRRLNVIERVTLSFGLSIVVVTLSLLLASVVGISINGLNSLLIIIVVTIVPALAYYLNKRIRRRRGSTTYGY